MLHRRFVLLIVVLMMVFALPLQAFAQEPTTTHTVQVGENLFRIGLLYGFTAEQLALANNIYDPAQIYVGQVLIIPLPIGGGEEFAAPVAEPAVVAEPLTTETQALVTSEVAPVEPVAPVVEAVAPTGEITHIVQANEGLATIARAYGVSWEEVARVNNIADPNFIYAGQQLTIPNPLLTPPADYGAPPTPADASRYILVELGKQKISAIQDDVVVREVIVSTGLPGTPTVQGDFHIYSKLPEQTMYGPGYYLPGVPWVMYFYGGYSIHGTYWHNNFGTPMSHGCVNLPTEDAAWFYDFAQVGTLVRVIP